MAARRSFSRRWRPENGAALERAATARCKVRARVPVFVCVGEGAKSGLLRSFGKTLQIQLALYAIMIDGTALSLQPQSY